MENNILIGTRVDCLYRVSTDKQVDYDDKSQADIPMQRRECHRFCEKIGSGRLFTKNRRTAYPATRYGPKTATNSKSSKNGPSRASSIFCWCSCLTASGVSLTKRPLWWNGLSRTASGYGVPKRVSSVLIPTPTNSPTISASGKLTVKAKRLLSAQKPPSASLSRTAVSKAGLAPYGYDLVKSGRFNKRKHEVYELVVNEAEAAVVRIIFDKYVHEGYGAQRIATYLNKLGYRARSGKMWHHASIRGIICNLTYTGVLRSGDSRSQVLLHLQIIPPELFEAAQHIRTSRANSAEQERRVPLNTRGQSLLAGECVLWSLWLPALTHTNGKAYPCKDDPNRIVKRVRYICYGKTRKQTECDGQTGYTAHTLDGIIDKVVRQIFERMKAVPKSEIVNIRYKEKMEERKALLRSIRAEHTKVSAELNMLKAEVIKSLRGESAFSQDLLGSLISDCETKCLEVQQQLEAAQLAYDEGQAVLEHLNAQYDDIISWADMYDTASMEAKKMIVNCLIKRVGGLPGLQVAYRLNIDFEQFSMGMDIVAIAA